MAKGEAPQRGAQGPKKARGKTGSGSRHQRALAGRGPTPKAVDRTWHPAHKKKAAKEAAAAQAAARAKSMSRSRVKVAPGNELVVGRNPVVEAARAGIKISTIYLASDPDQGKMREVFELLAQTGAPFVEVTKRDLDRVSDGAAHQGIAI